ncbi:MAG: peptidase M23B family [Desulfovibrionaceae bacterium]|nr:MAG: peptidase M23B family [Desulfovibrionaceae bacterium]
MSLTPDVAAQTSLALSARGAAQARAMSQPLNQAKVQANGQAGGQASQAPKMPEKSFGKILESLTPEKAAAAGMSPEAQKTLTAQAMNKRFAPGPSEEKKLREACEGFESVFIGQMLKEMRKTVQKDGLLHRKEEDQYVAMFDEELSKTLTKQGGIGLADFMQQQLATRAVANTARPVPPAEGGLRRSASDTMALVAPGKPMQRNFRDKGLRPLQAAGSLQGNAVVLSSDAVRPGMPASTSTPAVSADAQATKRPGSLAGTPSQQLGMPGSQYLQGKDAQLAAAGEFISPVSGELTSEYGWRRDPFTGQRAWHGGMDIAAPEGTPVRAARDGTVVFSGRERGYGNLVVVEHEGGVRTYYGHNKTNEVAEGQSVKAGQVLAQVGQTGRATGPHLHFEVRVDGRSVDPASQGGATVAAATGPEIQVPVL